MKISKFFVFVGALFVGGSGHLLCDDAAWNRNPIDGHSSRERTLIVSPQLAGA